MLTWETSPDVEFCAYTIPHPSEAKMNVRIQTYGRGTPVQCEHTHSTANRLGRGHGGGRPSKGPPGPRGRLRRHDGRVLGEGRGNKVLGRQR